jgi:uncharacterized protein
MNRLETRLYKILQELEKTGRLEMEKNYRQHGTTTVYQHSVNVADKSCRFAQRLNMKLDYDSLIRGALLHDYFLYDWHDKNHGHSPHGFTHPGTALKNAEEDFSLNDIEKNIINRHMFPLTIIPPNTREAWIVCLIDKLCAFQETTQPFLTKKKNGMDQYKERR